MQRFIHNMFAAAAVVGFTLCGAEAASAKGGPSGPISSHQSHPATQFQGKSANNAGKYSSNKGKSGNGKLPMSLNKYKGNGKKPVNPNKYAGNGKKPMNPYKYAGNGKGPGNGQGKGPGNGKGKGPNNGKGKGKKPHGPHDWDWGFDFGDGYYGDYDDDYDAIILDGDAQQPVIVVPGPGMDDSAPPIVTPDDDSTDDSSVLTPTTPDDNQAPADGQPSDDNN